MEGGPRVQLLCAVQRWPWLGAGSQTTSCTPNRGHQHTILCIPVFTHLHPGRGVEEELHHRGTDPAPPCGQPQGWPGNALLCGRRPRPSQAVPLKRKDVWPDMPGLNSLILVAGRSSLKSLPRIIFPHSTAGKSASILIFLYRMAGRL